jgi:hypothetical protein
MDKWLAKQVRPLTCWLPVRKRKEKVVSGFKIWKVFNYWQVLAPAGTTPSVKHFRSHSAALDSVAHWFDYDPRSGVFFSDDPVPCGPEL